MISSGELLVGDISYGCLNHIGKTAGIFDAHVFVKMLYGISLHFKLPPAKQLTPATLAMIISRSNASGRSPLFTSTPSSSDRLPASTPQDEA